MAGEVRIAERMQRIQPFYVMDLLARARAMEAQGREVIHMEIGEPDFPTPEPIVAAGHQALRDGRTYYTPALGLPQLREAIAGYYRQRFQMALAPERVAVTPGASGALQLTLSVLVDPGQAVLMADPGYPCNRHFVELIGGRPVLVPTGPDSGYQLTAALVEAAWVPGTRAVILASPSNPTGTLVPPGETAAIGELVASRGAMLVVDEIYQGLVYDAEPGTALSECDNVFVINSFSKYFGMTGWRLGWVVAPLQYMSALDRLAQNIFLAPATLSQYAALAAFGTETKGILEGRRREFQRRRDFLVPALRALGFELPCVPQGAFYLYAGCDSLATDSDRFAGELLERQAVAVTPGRDFGRHESKRHLRFAYTTSLENLEKGVRRIRAFVES